MLDRNEQFQARTLALRAMAETYNAIHAPHGTYRYLIELGSVLCYAHSPVGRVLYHFDD